MDYEKKYKDLVEAVKTLKEANPSDEGIQNWVKDNVPELQKSEDERIRKAIYIYLDWLEGRKDYAPKGKYSIRDMLAWLEKQDEQKPVIEMKSAEESLGIDSDTYNEIVDECIYGEQEPTDKVEPKFKIGDWINGYYTNYKVLSVNNDGYVVEDVDGNKINILFENEEFHHLWTIQDAKDGDVLYLQHDGKEHIIIYKGVIKERFRTFISAYCAYNSIVDAFCFADVSRYTDIAYGGIMPATKEQRDTLFTKMKEAGYEWDVEKKELKKQEIAEIPFGAKDSELQEASYHIPKGFHAEIDGNKVVIKKGNQKPAWSEEDEKRVHRISDFIWKNRKGDTDEIYQQEQDVNWLKSLRLQNRWKPSDEQMTALRRMKAAIAGEGEIYKPLNSLYEDLKKLREE